MVGGSVVVVLGPSVVVVVGTVVVVVVVVKNGVSTFNTITSE